MWEKNENKQKEAEFGQFKKIIIWFRKYFLLSSWDSANKIHFRCRKMFFSMSRGSIMLRDRATERLRKRERNRVVEKKRERNREIGRYKNRGREKEWKCMRERERERKDPIFSQWCLVHHFLTTSCICLISIYQKMFLKRKKPFHVLWICTNRPSILTPTPRVQNSA